MVSDDEFAAWQERLVTVERRCEVLEGTKPAAAPSPSWPTQADFLSQVRGSPGFVVDPGVARDTPCTCYHVKENDLCWSKGIVGALDKEQEELYCSERDYKELSPAQQERLQNFQASADACKLETKDVPKGEELQPWLSCMSKELRSRGIEE